MRRLSRPQNACDPRNDKKIRCAGLRPNDEGGTASLAYGAAAADAARSSRVSVLIGPDGRIAVAYAEVVPAEHPDQVLADLDRLG